MRYSSRRSYAVKIKEPLVYEVLDSCMLMAKNVYNASLYLILNLHSSYSYNKETLSYHLKDNLHANQIEGKNKNHHDFSGIRNDRIYTFKQGKQFIFKGKTLIKIHADINGGLNIPRKVFKSYNPNSLMSLNYEVIGQSTKTNWKSNRNKNNLNNDGKTHKIIPAKYKPYFKVMNSSHFNRSLQS